jgi:NAD(P)H-flavin reductase
MIRETAQRGLNRRIHLIYGSRNKLDIIFVDELEQIAARHPNITFHSVISNPPRGYKGLKGFITAALMKVLLGDFSEKTFYVCGPDVMYAFCVNELTTLGIPKRRIRTEVYGPPKDVTKQPGWPKDIGPDAVFSVRIKGGAKIEARSAEPLMISLERAGLVIPALCRSGECSLCRTKMLQGQYFSPKG